MARLYVRGPTSHMPSIRRSLNIQASGGYFDKNFERCVRDAISASFWRFTEPLTEDQIASFLHMVPQVPRIYVEEQRTREEERR